MSRIKFLITLLFFTSIHTYAQIRLPSIIGDNMVLKRNSTSKIWGWNTAGANIYIVAEWSLTDTIVVRCDANSRFEAEIDTPEAGGPYTITLFANGKRKLLENVMIGEVWLCSGQSNMQMSMSTLYGTKVEYGAEMETLNNTQIYTFRTPLMGAETPQIDCQSRWVECSSKTIADVSLVGYFFAQKLQKKLNIPIGIVMSSWGGTPAETWISKGYEQLNLDLIESAKNVEENGWRPDETAAAYNAMIAPLVPFSFSGTIWYQGEDNVPRYQYYDSIMRTLIDCWRADFGKDMPFYFVEIAPFKYNGKYSGYASYLREQQQKTARYNNCGVVVINDLVKNTQNIHPENKKDVSFRLADMALNRIYGYDNIDCNYPEIEKVIPNGNKIIVKLKNCDKGVLLVNNEQTGFKIAEADGEFVDAVVKIDLKTNNIILSAKNIREPLYVRYLFDDSSVCGVKGANGLPLVLYRNDNF